MFTVMTLFLTPAYLQIDGNFTEKPENYDQVLSHMISQLASVTGASTAEVWDAYSYSGKQLEYLTCILISRKHVYPAYSFLINQDKC